jgi:hypothetical protein
MRIRSWSLLAIALVALTQLSCATVGLTPMQEPMPAARAGLLPEYRIFYDALQDYGDWTLIEPFGFVFRPYVDIENWRPYQYGYWAPSEVYGWVWISDEPFGWATYHYGDWLYDRYQGWVWIPGPDWGPAWVSWEETPDYVGWAPMCPAGYDQASVPGGAYLYVTLAQLPAPDVQSLVRTKAQVGEGLDPPRRVENPRQIGGVTFNAGPRFAEFERRFGPLPRVRIEDLLPADGGVTKPGARPDHRPASAPSVPPAFQKPGTRSAPATTTDETAAIQLMKHAAEEAARSARAVTERSAAPPQVINVLRRKGRIEATPSERPGEAVPRERPLRPGRRPAAADSTRQR